MFSGRSPLAGAQLPGWHTHPAARPARAEHLPANSPQVSKMYCLIREGALLDQDSNGEMQERAESVQPDQNVNTTATCITSAC